MSDIASIGKFVDVNSAPGWLASQEKLQGVIVVTFDGKKFQPAFFGTIDTSQVAFAALMLQARALEDSQEAP